ncbi:MAG: hypothetical protein HYW37_01020 [Candidatus Colwellbacteria bacterium]|nr:hypothetical protein [Candidatus Colwellbacteria bacterium]
MTLKIVLILTIVTIAAYGAFWFIDSLPEPAETDIISKSGIHWHPELSIYIKGVKQEISANIGIGVAHQPIHTHDATGTLHLEFSGLVAKDDVKLKNFFKNWGKEFNSTCVFDKCNGEDGTVKMYVNGRENKDFENYLMKDKDRIEIRYE